jgi:hypothetical protein
MIGLSCEHLSQDYQNVLALKVVRKPHKKTWCGNQPKYGRAGLGWAGPAHNTHRAVLGKEPDAADEGGSDGDNRDQPKLLRHHLHAVGEQHNQLLKNVDWVV